MQRLFHAGADQARIDEAEAVLQQELREYEATLLQAVAEVENSLADIHYGRERLDRIRDAAEASGEAYRALSAAFDDGLIDVRDLIQAERAYFDQRTEVLFAENSMAKAAVALYAATAGGDVPAPPESSTPSGIQVEEYPHRSLPSQVLSRTFSLNRDDRQSAEWRVFGGE